jgi:two-component system, NtrC family, nitrogen regulation sensor histidine kinase NtrY
LRHHLIFFLGLGILFTLISYFSSDYFKSYSELPRYQTKIERALAKTDQQIIQFIQNEDLVLGIFSGRKLASDELQILSKFKDELFTIIFYRQDQPVFWTNNVLIPDDFPFKSTTKRDSLLRHNTGFFWIKSYPTGQENTGQVLGAIPIKFEYTFPGSIFKNRFAASDRIPENLRVTSFKTQHPVISPDGETIAYLQAFNLKMKSGRLINFILHGLAYLFFGVFLHYLALRVTYKGYVLQGVSLLFLGIIIIRFLMDQTGLPDQFNGLFDLNATISDEETTRQKLGDTLINIILLFWLLIFTYRQLKLSEFTHLTVFTRIGLAVLNHFSILLGLVMFAGICKNLVLHTGIEFDFDNVFNLNSGSFFALIGVILFLLIFFIVSHRMTLTVKRLQLGLGQKLISIAGSFVLILPIFLNVNTGFPIYIFYLGAIVYLLLFDLFVDSEKPNITWMVIWLVVFAGFSSIILYKYKRDAGVLQRIDAAKTLLENSDPVLLQKTRELFTNLTQDSRIKNTLLLCDNKDEKIIELEKLITNSLDQNHYINSYYSYSVKHAINTTLPSYENNPVEPELSMESKGDILHHYLITSEYILTDSNEIIRSEIYLKRKRVSNQPDFSSLLYTEEYKGIDLLREYDYAIYIGDSLLESRGHLYERILPVSMQADRKLPAEIIFNNRTEVVCKEGAYTVLLGRELSGILKPLSLFSYLFAMLVTAIILLMLLNSFYPVFPSTIRLTLSGQLTLRNKIQIAVLALIIASFIFVGLVTVIYFNNSSHQNDKERLINKAISVQFDAQNKLTEINPDQPETKKIHEIVVHLSQIHQTDINLFDRSGKLLYSSDYEVFKNKLAAPYMNPTAWRTLLDLGSQMYINDREKLGDLTYKAAFLPILRDGAAPVAFISLPYSSAGSRDQGNVKGFMGTLLNVYVFLLLIAGAIAITVANSITRPISELGEKIRSFKLGKRNEPIIWKNQDELGVLIQEYNILIDKMEKSAELLAQNEREVAWREMAKQVAHEIKNPLTPMKLSIQHLQHKISHLPPEEVEPLINRVANTLIEQIDNLTRIASEFSNFSKLPKPNNEKLILNDLIASVHDLFRKREDIVFNLYVPIDEIFIYADRSHILRILNNLIKNAIQAIPAIRKGKIDIKLYTKNKKAVIQVSDNGSGIATDMQDKVFYPNFTTKSSGTGLGLAISKDIAEAYGGSIYFKTAENKGTDFYLEMPLMELQEGEE